MIFFREGIPGAVDFRRRYYLRRRHRPMVPAPSGTPMPDQAKYVRKRYLLYSLYMRPWTLCPEWSEDHMPYLGKLDVVPRRFLSPDLLALIEAAGVTVDSVQGPRI